MATITLRNQELVTREILLNPHFAGLAGLRLHPLSKDADVPDSSIAFRLKAGDQDHVLLISPGAYPDVVEQEVARAAEMKAALGDRLGAVILRPVATGRILASSYAVMPYRTPLSRRRVIGKLQRLRVAPAVRGWLAGLAAMAPANAVETGSYPVALEALARVAERGSMLEGALRHARAHLATGNFTARKIPMHGDLWQGNVLHGRNGSPFTIIDWRGSQVDGYPLFDLMAFANSFGLTAPTLASELAVHQRGLQCDGNDMLVYLLGGLGHVAGNLGQFPLPRFLTMANAYLGRFLKARGTATA